MRITELFNIQSIALDSAAAAEAVLKPLGGNCAVLPKEID